MVTQKKLDKQIPLHSTWSADSHVYSYMPMEQSACHQCVVET